MSKAQPRARRRGPRIAWGHAQGWTWLPDDAPDASAPVLVVLDVAGETMANIQMPATLWGPNRRAYLQTQVEFALPGVALRAVWPSPSVYLPRADELVVFGVDDPGVQRWIEEALQAQRPIVGVWTLTQALYAHTLKGPPEQLAVLETPHGLRLLWQKNGKARFTRLIPAAEGDQWLRELEATIRYLRDQRMAAREQPVVLRWYGSAQTAPILGEHTAQVEVVPTPRGHKDWWRALLQRSERGLPAQLAPLAWRRYAVSRRARQALAAASILIAVGLGYDAALLAADGLIEQQRLGEVRQAAEQQQQRVQSMQQQVQQTGIEPALLRAAIAEVDAAQASAAADPAAIAQTTAQWLQRVPGLVGHQVSWTQTLAPCAGDSAPGAGAPVPAANTTPQWELRLSVGAVAELSRAEQERQLYALDKVLRSDARWLVKRDTLSQRDRASLRLGSQADQTSDKRDAALAQWCLVLRPELGHAAPGAPS
ncbi:MAG: hypothetical protein ACUVVU_06380 [Tepidimonas sp.]|uniref:hypothetical protein n=1 Tax=Tepidimonas sp. TaxID=2002775 RepID=UPI004054FF48